VLAESSIENSQKADIMSNLLLTKKKINVVIIVYQEVMREGIKTILKSPKSSYEFSFIEAANVDLAFKTCKPEKHDVLVIDCLNGDETSVQKISKIKDRWPEIGIIALFDSITSLNVYKMILAGAKGLLLKTFDKHQLISAIESIANGELYHSNEIEMNFIKSSNLISQSVTTQKYSLTKREIEIIKHIAQGMTNREIANSLYVSKRTVDTHRQNILYKLGVNNTAGILKIAFLLNLL